MSRAGKSRNVGQFPKGRSGNPAGRPRKTPAPRSSAFDVVADRTLEVIRNGVAREITWDEALQHRTYNDALDGKRPAKRAVLKWIEKRDDWYAKRSGKPQWDEVSRKRSPDPDNADAALELLGIVSRDDGFDETDPYWPRHLLELWAVQAALDRRRGVAPIPKRDVDEILRVTREGGRLRWPGGSRE